MDNGPARPAEEEPMSAVRTRSIGIVDITGEQDRQRIIEALTRVNGVKSVAIDDSRRVLIEYDLICVDYGVLEKRLQELGFEVEGSIWAWFKRGWLQFIEANERDNHRAPVGTYCSDPKRVYKRFEK
jgi:copper chaperone CopZ